MLLLTIAVVVLAVVLVTRPPRSPAPLGIATPSATASVSPSSSITDSSAPTATTTPPTATPTRAATAPPVTSPPTSTTPAEQAALQLYPAGVECGFNGDYGGCPVTQDLTNAAGQWRNTHGPTPPAPLCRCLGSYDSTFVQQDDKLLPLGNQGDQSMAAVQVQLSFPSNRHETLVVLFKRQSNGSWRAVDTYCGDTKNLLGAANATSCVQ